MAISYILDLPMTSSSKGTIFIQMFQPNKRVKMGNLKEEEEQLDQEKLKSCLII